MCIILMTCFSQKKGKGGYSDLSGLCELVLFKNWANTRIGLIYKIKREEDENY